MKHGALQLLIGFEGKRGISALCGEITDDVIYENFQGVSSDSGFRNFYNAIECPRCKARIDQMMEELKKLMEASEEDPF